MEPSTHAGTSGNVSSVTCSPFAPHSATSAAERPVLSSRPSSPHSHRPPCAPFSPMVLTPLPPNTDLSLPSSPGCPPFFSVLHQLSTFCFWILVDSRKNDSGTWALCIQTARPLPHLPLTFSDLRPKLPAMQTRLPATLSVSTLAFPLEILFFSQTEDQ